MKMIEGAKYMLDRNIEVDGRRFNAGEVFTLIRNDEDSEVLKVGKDGEEMFMPTSYFQQIYGSEPSLDSKIRDVLPEPQVEPSKPDHYDTSIDPIAYMKANYPSEQVEGFLVGNVLKYITRYRKKNGVEDLRKSEHYLKMLIEHVEGGE